jgi:hypothetical protein
MQPQFLDGLVVPTPWGRRTIRVADVNADAGEAQTICYSFVEDPAVLYRLIVARELLVTYPTEVRALVSQWTSAGHPNGSDQPLTLDAVEAARDAIALPRGGAGTIES